MVLWRTVTTRGATYTKFRGEFMESIQKIKQPYVTKLDTFILHNTDLKYAVYIGIVTT
jgi:hypothetical protein